MSAVCLEEYDLLGDAKYRSYVSAIDKALKSFEYTTEWADLISALGKLNKVLSSHMRYPVIPRRITISKRLGQCMHHALPAGVHLKAIETYDIIFKCIGTNRLSQELFIYSAGLFPLLGHAAMNVKPALLTIYETHFVPLRERLQPGLHGFLVGVLAALEETSEYFQRTSELLEQICEGVDPSFFYGALWDCVVSNPSIRLPAVSFALDHYNKKHTMEDQLYMMGTDIDTMVKAFCLAVQDSNILVQRSTLDLLQLCFPMHNSQLLKPDMSNIVTCAVLVVLRRDMSLNRRLFAWLLGSDVNPRITQQLSFSSDKPVTDSEDNASVVSNYFNQYSRDLLICAMINCLKKEIISSEHSGLPDLWCYRLLQSLLDKPEIASSVLDDILVQVFRALYEDYNNPKKLTDSARMSKNSSELLKAANLFFSTLEPDYIWSYIIQLFRSSASEASKEYESLKENGCRRTCEMKVLSIGSMSHSLLELCLIINFLLDVMALEAYSDTPSQHLPDLLMEVCHCVTEHMIGLTPQELTTSLSLCSKILSKIQPNIETESIDGKQSDDESEKNNSPEIQGTSQDSPDKKFEQFDRFRVEEIDVLFEHPISCIQQCIVAFQHLFIKFFRVCVFEDSLDNVLTRFSDLLVEHREDFMEKQHALEQLLWKCIGVNFTPNKFGRSYDSSKKYYRVSDECLVTKLNIKELSEPFGYACQLLLDLSSFPAYGSKYQKSSNRYHRNNQTALPSWLNLLLLSCCFVDDTDFHFISSATILDLISVAKSVMEDSKSIESDDNQPDENKVVSVKITPVLTSQQLKYIETETRFYSMMAVKLWNYLGASTSEHHLKAVELFVLLRNLLPDESICEDAVSSAMTQEDDMAQVEAMNKFSVLWHVTREMKSKGGFAHSVNFDRSLFIMLESLDESTGAQKSVAQAWLAHCIQMNDLSRIFEPIHLMLLHSDSARVSIQHVSINRPKKVKVQSKEEVNSDEAKIYAISSIEGNVIYHVGSDDSKPSSKIGSPERRILALTSILNPDDKNVKKGHPKIVTANSMIQEFDVPSSHEQQFSQIPMSLYMNPFGSLMSVRSDSEFDTCSSQADLGNAKRVDIAAAKRKASFDMEDADDDSESARTQTPDSTCQDISPVGIVTSILDDIIAAVTRDDSVTLTSEFMVGDDTVLTMDDQSSSEEFYAVNKDITPDNVIIHPLHTHLLLYYQVYDADMTLHGLSMLKTVLSANPRAVLCAMSTTSINNVHSSRHQLLLSLLARHKKSVFGKNFHGDLTSSELTSYRSSMYIEVTVLLCLYYMRGYYPNNLTQMRLSVHDITGNRNVQLMSAEVLSIVFSELINFVKDSSKSLASYVAEIMNKCKLQKTVLHCLMASVYNASHLRHKNHGETSLTDAIVDFNESIGIDEKNRTADGDEIVDFSNTFQIQLLRLLLIVIILEDEVFVQKAVDQPGSTKSRNVTENNGRSSKINFVSSSPPVKYQQGLRISAQPMFLACILNALKQQYSSTLHTHWMNLITLALPYMGKSLCKIVSSAVCQLCMNLETTSEVYSIAGSSGSRTNFKNPPDYMIVLLDGLTSLCHYCILDNTSQVTSTINQPTATTPSSPIQPSQIFSNLIHVFSSNSSTKVSSSKDTSQPTDPIITARKSLLSSLPRIISALATVWHSMQDAENMAGDSQQHSCWIMGHPKSVKQQILRFVSPISLHHGSHFLGALGLIWCEQNQKKQEITSTDWTEKQSLLVNLISSIKILPIDTLVQNIRQVIKQPPHTSDKKSKKITLEVGVLQFFLAYIQAQPSSYLQESWSSLVPLWKEGLQLTSQPQIHFLLLGILNEFVQKTPLPEDKKELRELQDIAQRLVEVCSDIAGSSLEQTNWLRRNLAVKTIPQYDCNDFDHDGKESSEGQTYAKTSSTLTTSQYSVQALIVLASYVAPLLDVIYVSEEKEKIVPLISNIMHYVTPYLKNHSKSNVPSFRASSQLLRSLSGYQYTRKAWKKDAFELLMDNTFFQMDHSSLMYWKSVIDHLMTHDKTTFRDLIARVSLSQSSTLNLFSSKDQEYEQRAQFLKRLAFVIFCSENDQYQRYMPDIQERLSECLRLQVPALQSQVFLCFRVLLVRLSSQHITSLWPVIITEMVQIFLQIENELSVDSDDFSAHLKRLSSLDSSWVITNGLNAHNNPVWLQLYLSVCKLLDLVLVLPAEDLPQFQIYKWAFVGETIPTVSNNNMKKTAKSPSKPDFIPHITRLANIMSKKTKCKDRLTVVPGCPMLNVTSIKKLRDLYPFFATLSETCRSERSATVEKHSRHSNLYEMSNASMMKSKSAPNLEAEETNSRRECCSVSSLFDNLSNVQYIDRLLELDFLEGI
ncbi:DOPEY1 (predicted) [Pycnogonum litorale]